LNFAYETFLATYYRVINIKEDEMGRACITHGNIGNTYKVLADKPVEKKHFKRSLR
jgi:hypothetical protein